MKRFAVLIAATLVTVSCKPENEVTGSIHNRCASELYASYNPKVLDQCVTVCMKCDRGTRVTCSTSCTLQGAH